MAVCIASGGPQAFKLYNTPSSYCVNIVYDHVITSSFKTMGISICTYGMADPFLKER